MKDREYLPPLTVVKRADRVFLIDQDDRVVAKGPLEQFERFKGIEAEASRRIWGLAILRLLGFER